MTHEQQNTNTANVPPAEPAQTQQPPVTPEATPGNAEQVPGEPAQQQAQQPADNPPPADETPSTGTVPESFEAYDIAIEGFDLEAFSSHESNKAFLEKAHGLGISNEQMTAVLEAYEQHAAVQVEVLQEEWGTEFEGNLRFAQQAAKAAGLTMDDIDSPTFGIKLAAFYGKQLQEDMPPVNTQPTGGVDVQQLMSSEAYLNESHPDHKRVYAQVQSFYEQQFK